MTYLSGSDAVTDRHGGGTIIDTTVNRAPSVSGEESERIRRFLDHERPATPCLAVDLAVVRNRYSRLRAELPEARICYAVKANPEPRVVAELVRLGASFDVASPGEIELCLRQGAPAGRISYGNTIKKPGDIARAHQRGVGLFATDSTADLENIAAAAPGSAVFCRVAVDNTGSRTPFGRKFGCTPADAVRLLRRARDLGLVPYGVSFHIGSQQLAAEAWEHGIAAAAEAMRDPAMPAEGVRMINLGGGLPATYTQPTPGLHEYTEVIESALRRHFGDQRPEVLLEPGRHLVGDAGVLRSEVVLVSADSAGEGRWVYLDAGRYNGLAETEGEAITYRLRTSRDGDPLGPVVLAGPTCDGDDVLYQRSGYELPTTLCGGDTIDLLSAGAYTASYSSVCFNGFEPLSTRCFDSAETTERA
ncbi:ornithine decarboxylase [Actinopolyspora erythraea]|uniref:ornithine decarboxylase n=1 Tax=Actinopolyspora erythraea TaxID=414996 RepID=A0A099CZU9_9ACTN|nr:type III PLP-dependent enzyme [Actinopolyspora erythraea]ASU79602.1 ornithine decarboxylase [Actinopolyspora erythraea]KGI79478.1 ornithine decarboxylase [Actinopolyspora erythraea]